VNEQSRLPQSALPGGTVTFLFTDIQGSTQLLNQLRDQYASLLAEHHQIIRAALEQWGGREVDTQGDAFFAAFPKATQAVAAVAEIQRALAEYEWPEGVEVRVRMGLHTGEPWLVEEGYVGMDVHRAARIGHTGHGGQVLLSETAAALVRDELPEGVSLVDLGRHRLKDMRRPETIHQLTIEGLPGDFPPLKSLEALPAGQTDLSERVPTGASPYRDLATFQESDANLFFGREAELAELEALLLDRGSGLISIVGPGGIGKTRLAVEVALHVADHFADGAAFVNLAPLQTAESIVPSLVQALRFKPAVGNGETRQLRQQLLDYLQGKALLLVLDNFEHLLEGVPLLVEILAVAPQTKLLVTSRERLKLQAEQLYPLQGLAYSDWQTIEDARRDPAVRLFLHYGRRLRPGFELQAEELGTLDHILHLAEGMPLAIILAAAWLQLLTLAEIAAEIESSLDFLEADYRDLPERQRTMRAVFESTWRRLSERERLLFAALSVFRGGFTLEAAREVTDASPRELLGLVDRSLLVRNEEGRFEVHELLRQFAAEELGRYRPHDEAVFDRHSAYYLAFLWEREPDLKGARTPAVLQEIETEIQNHQAAWEWAVSHKESARIRSAAFSLATFYLRSGRLYEGLAAFGRAVDDIGRYVSGPDEADGDNLRTLASLLAWKSEILFLIGSTDEAEACDLEALTLLERPELEGRDVRVEKALIQLCLGRVYEWLDRYQEATVHLEQSIANSRSLGDHWLMADAIHLLGGVALRRGNYELAIRRLKEAQIHYHDAGDRRSEAYVQMWAAICQTWWWPSPEAERQIGKSRAVFQEVGDLNAEYWAIAGLGWACLYLGRFEQARLLIAEAFALSDRLGMVARQAGTIGYEAEAIIHQGDYGQALSRLRQGQEIGRNNQSPITTAMLLVFTGRAKLAQGHSDDARKLVAEGAAILRRISQNDDLSQALAVLSCAHADNGEIAQAKHALAEALTLAEQLRTFGAAKYGLSAAAHLLARLGESERAVEIYALAREHEFVAKSRWFEDVTGQSVAAAAENLPAEDVAAAKARGEARDVWQTADELLQQLQPGEISGFRLPDVVDISGQSNGRERQVPPS
jgi:predicted ATPase/class 3 adenylate cyclase